MGALAPIRKGSYFSGIPYPVPIFHNDETRWEVFVEIEGKAGTRWYLWVTRSQSVIFYCIDPKHPQKQDSRYF
ncbi:MAG: transposase [Gammaproteobacteria bacterium]|nr:transposase [Gammaproteobacteria bacterium]